MALGRTPLTRFKRWINATFTEWAARRNGRRHTPRDNANAARDVTGPLGAPMSGTYNQLARSSDAYIKSFDRRLPPSIHISERDRIRHGDAIPMAERAIADWKTDNRTDDPS